VNSGTVRRLELTRTSYSNSPILAVPEGRITFAAGRRGGRLAERGLRLKEIRIEVDHDLALFAAVGIGNNRARNGDELWAEKILAEVVELLLGKAFAGEPKLENGDAGGAVINDERRERARRQLAKDGLRDGGDLSVGVSRLELGWRNILTMAWPLTVVDSMCSTLSTVVVRMRS